MLQAVLKVTEATRVQIIFYKLRKICDHSVATEKKKKITEAALKSTSHMDIIVKKTFPFTQN